MEAEYLKRTVGLALAAGLAEVAAKRPGDPIEYLAHWLLKHKENTLNREQEGPLEPVPVSTRDEEVPPAQAMDGGREDEGENVVDVPAVSGEPPVITSEDPPSQPPPSERPQESAHTLGKIEEETGEQLAMETTDDKALNLQQT